MSAAGILAYTLRAGRFALAVLALWAALRAVLALRRRTSWKREALLGAAVFYLAALVQIIALRGGPGQTRQAQLVPMRTTLAQLRAGAWPFAYHLIGNMVWFVPLGILAPKLRSQRAADPTRAALGFIRVLALGAALSACLEALQFILGTGVTDVDDVLVNALGAGAGWLIERIFSRQRRVSP